MPFSGTNLVEGENYQTQSVPFLASLQGDNFITHARIVSLALAGKIAL